MLAVITFVILAMVCLFVLDDIFIDLVAFFKQLEPKVVTKYELKKILRLKEKNIAVIIANWHESDVLEKMIQGNIRSIKYKKYHFFLGVYPNDVETSRIACELDNKYSRVHRVVNTRNGPTTKGQMMNEIVRYIMSEEAKTNIKYDIFLMHDSEDIIHPLSLKLINSEIVFSDFIQIPIFSNDRLAEEWVGSTYIDEFNEIHTKDMFVRAELGAPVPSAGTGTALKHSLMLKLVENNKGSFLKEDSLTEDYVLGMSSAMMGFKTSFCCRYTVDDKGVNNFIATREHFPNRYKAAIRQKTRWIVGIAFQGIGIVPWRGSFAHKYFLYRDRKGPLNNFLSVCTAFITIDLLLYPVFYNSMPEFMNDTWFKLGSLLATIGMFNRIYHRIKAVIIINGWKHAWLVPFRWPIGIFINFFATMNAINKYYNLVIKNETLQWAKTNHELPIGFGNELQIKSTESKGEIYV